MAGIYVHIPFCHAKCAYCDFYSTPDRSLADRVVNHIVEEYAERIDEIGPGATTIYFGGGTPSSLTIEQLRTLTDALPMHEAQECTIEVNPEDVSAESAAAWRQMGFNRVSMGVQSLVDTELAAVARRHSAVDALRAFELLRGQFDNISLDLIYGLPGQTLASWHISLRGVLALLPEHFSAYSLSYEPGTRLYAAMTAGRIVPADDTLTTEMYQALCTAARQAGYEHYEISNFALPGRKSQHNSSYWDSTPYLGIGPAAHSFDGMVRRANPRSIRHYLAAKVTALAEDETADERFNDLIITRLRTAAGIDLTTLPAQQARDLQRGTEPWVRSGHVSVVGSRIAITEQGWLMSDAIMRDLIVV